MPQKHIHTILVLLKNIKELESHFVYVCYVSLQHSYHNSIVYE